MNEQLAIKRSMQLMSLFGGGNSCKDLLNLEPDVRILEATQKQLYGLLWLHCHPPPPLLFCCGGGFGRD